MSLIEKTKQYVKKKIAPDFHDKRIASLADLRLAAVLKRKNPYLFKAKAVISAPDLVKQLLLAHLSSQEETLFGAFLEGMAIHICGYAYDGRKSTTEGIDLEFIRNGMQFVVSIKSGPNWGNSSQIAKMIQNFDRARRIAGAGTHVVAVNGCCYGKDTNPHKVRGNYLKLCGQDFWQLISGEPFLYQEIIEPLGHEACQKNDAFEEAFARLHTRFTADFTRDFCHCDASIDWEKIVALNSRAKALWNP
ncbi:MAG: hypothetical protein JSC189_000194 [Candidatus Tokpelaia sp. JSC189]|nr:MAG: hypothetical protein JSC189_000194 [Candidatus Tokpelaia sp. JSC189]